LDNEDLLKPTLSGYRQPPAIYNSTGFFLAAFFGGPVGAAVYGSANAWRLGRLARDLPVIVVIAAAAFLGMLELDRLGALDRLMSALGGRNRQFGVVLRGFGIACFGAIYFLHRGYFRAARVSGVAPRPGWGPGIAAVLAGMAANVAFASWILQHD
jgi:hypothetical protein